VGTRKPFAVLFHLVIAEKLGSKRQIRAGDAGSGGSVRRGQEPEDTIEQRMAFVEWNVEAPGRVARGDARMDSRGSVGGSGMHRSIGASPTRASA
jgi:hypothetical protein